MVNSLNKKGSIILCYYIRTWICLFFFFLRLYIFMSYLQNLKLNKKQPTNKKEEKSMTNYDKRKNIHHVNSFFLLVNSGMAI